MPTPLISQVVTASDLLLGDVIYQTANDGWTRQLSCAEVITDEAHAQMRLLDATRQGNTVVGAYLAEISPSQTGQSGPETLHFREASRATGPSNYPHGKQETAQNV